MVAVGESSRDKVPRPMELTETRTEEMALPVNGPPSARVILVRDAVKFCPGTAGRGKGMNSLLVMMEKSNGSIPNTGSLNVIRNF